MSAKFHNRNEISKYCEVLALFLRTHACASIEASSELAVSCPDEIGDVNASVNWQAF